MANVQLSSGLSARPCSFSRHQETQPRARVCRNLFGPVDHEELNQDLKNKLHQISERDQQRWNFNFDAGTPLAGDYEWEEAAAETSPAFYHQSVARRTGLTAPELPKADSRVNNDADQMKGEVSAVNRTSNSGAGVRRKRRSSLTSTHITDFYAKRKSTEALRHRGSGFGKLTAPSLTTEQTPRKGLR